MFGCVQLVIHEIDDAAATPLQAVKLLALYLSSPENKVPFCWIRCCFLPSFLIFFMIC